MKLFSLSFIRKAKEWYDNISPGETTNWDTFQALFIRIFAKFEELVSLYDQLYVVRGNRGRTSWISMTGLISS